MSYLYINPGYGNLFHASSQNACTQVTDDGTPTGQAFRGCGTRTLYLPEPLEEIWLRFNYKCNSTAGDSYIYVMSSNRNVCHAHWDDRNMRFRVHDSDKVSMGYTSGYWNKFLMHVKTGTNDGIFEVWENGDLKCSFKGNVLNGEQIRKFQVYNNSSCKFISNIILSDTKIKWTENIITIPTTISGTMTDNEDGTYSATEAGQYVSHAIDTASLQESYPANTVITGYMMAGRPAYYDGDGIDIMQATANDTIVGECALGNSSVTSIFYGERVDKTIDTFGGTYMWTAKSSETSEGTNEENSEE